MTRFTTFAGTQTGKQLDFAAFLSTLAPPAITARGVLGMFNYDVTNTLGQITVAILVVGADTDRLTKLESSITMNNSIPRSSLVTLLPAGHMGFVERHQEINEAVAGFITSL